MSARVLNPMLMTDMSRRGGLAGGRVVPTKAELAPIRRDLFGPVDHAANRALAERELRAQSRLDAERWGFDFQKGLPCCDARYTWEVVTPSDVVPEPYALRGMPYLRKHAPGTPRKINTSSKFSSSRTISGGTTISTTTTTSLKKNNNNSNNKNNNNNNVIDDQTGVTTPSAIIITPNREAEMTPPQESRVPDISNRSCEITPEEVPRELLIEDQILKQSITEDPTTPILPISARKQSAITDYMRKSRKRSMKGSSPKSIVEPPEKMSRNAGQIRS